MKDNSKINPLDYVRVNISTYTKNPKLLSCLSDNVVSSMFASQLKGEGHIYLHKIVLLNAEIKYEKIKAFDKHLKLVNSLNNKGSEYEKSGKFKNAITKYEKCMEIMYNYNPVHIAWHSPDRLRVLYKKIGSSKELEFLETFANFCNNNSIEIPEIYNKRLNQLKIKTV